jgi:hypothetical protein
MDKSLFIGIPAYNGMVHIDCVNTLLGLGRINLSTATMFLGNESLITRGRNTIFSVFLHQKNFTHLLFLDADVGMNASDILKLLNYDKDVIGVPVRLKGVDKKGNPAFNVGKIFGPADNGLIKVSKVGTAVMMVSRKACEDLVLKTNPQTYSKGFNNGVNLESVIQYDVFGTGVIDGEYQSEDFWFCEELRKIGYDIFVDPNIKTVHNGVIQLI